MSNTPHRRPAAGTTGNGRRRTTTAVARTTPPKPKARDDQLTYLGNSYQLADKIGVWPMMQLSRAAEQGLSSNDSKGLAALHAMFEDMIHPDDWGRFQEDMIAAKLDDPIALLQTTQEAVTKYMDRLEKQKQRAIPGEVADPEANGHGQVPAGLRRDYDIEP